MTLRLTGERLMPDQQWGDTNHREHMARYALAGELVDLLHAERTPRDNPLAITHVKALDIASGEGYGTAFLGYSGAEVVGVDISPEAVQYAITKYAGRYQVGDVRALPQDWSLRFDLVTCFETIEHVSEIEAALDELRRVMSPHGVLTISTPNAGVYPEGNPFHERELSTDEFAELLEVRWPSVQLFRQRTMPASVLAPAEDAKPYYKFNVTAGRLVELNKIEAGSEMYAVAICSDKPRYLAGAVAW